MTKPRFTHKKLLAALVWSCFFICSCENDEEVVRNLGKKKIGIEEALHIESYLSQDGHMKARLTAPLMLRYQLDTPKVEFPKGLHVDFFNDSLKVESQLNARYGEYFENENKVFLKDHVVVFKVTGDTLYTEELYWDQRKESFYTDKNVIIHKPDQSLYGSGMTADQSFKNITIKDTRGFLIIPDSVFLGTQ